MLFNKWHRTKASVKRAKPRSRGAVSRYRPHLECLEARTLLTLSPPVTFTAGAQPDALVLGDFNGDGRSDLAVVNQASSTVSVLLGANPGLPSTSGIAFTPDTGSPYAVNNRPWSIAAGDFNRDGRLDLAVASSGTPGVTVLLGNTGKTGGFSPASASPFAAGTNPYAVVVGDFNRDGKPDLAVANSGDFNTGAGSSVSIMLGDGSGGFSLASIAAGAGSRALAVGDFNADGKQDLAVANWDDHNVSVLLGDGGGGFAAATGSPIALGDRVISVVVGDFNRNGDLDLAVARLDGQVMVLLGKGNGTFAPATPFASASGGGSSLATGDVNGDGRLDLVVANFQTANVSVLLGTGGVSPLPLFQPAVNFPAGPYPTAVGLGDFNRDGKLDLVVTNGLVSSTAVSVLLNHTAAFSTTGTAVTVPQGTTATSVAVATFTDAHGPVALENYRASIDWGDGLAASSGTISLSDPTFTVMGSHSFLAPGRYPVSVTIQDENGISITANANAVVGNANQRFVSQAYRDLLRRPVDVGGLAFWAGLLDQHLLSRNDFVQALVTSLEYRVYTVIAVFQQFLRRATDAGGLRFWVNFLASGGTAEQLKANILGSPEYFNNSGGTNDKYLQMLYLDLFGRPIDDGGRTFWNQQLNGGLTRPALAQIFVTTTEALQTLVKGFYLTYLHRAGDSNGVSGLSAALQNGTLRDEDVIRILVASDEYFGNI